MLWGKSSLGLNTLKLTRNKQQEHQIVINYCSNPLAPSPMSKPTPKCKEHNSQVETVCNYKDCQSRGMCLLCDHNHVFLPTIRQSIPIHYSKFLKKLNSSIDSILSSTIQKSKQQQHKNKAMMIHSYFDDGLKCISQLWGQLKGKVMGMLEGNEEDLPGVLRGYRIDGNYLSAGEEDWKLLMSIYEGNQIEQYYLEKNEGINRKIDEELKGLRKLLLDFQEKCGVSIKQNLPEPPQLSKIDSKQMNKLASQYKSSDLAGANSFPSLRQFKDKLLVDTSKIEFDSILTDGACINSLLYTTSYDKKLRVVSKDLVLLKQHEFNNTLESILPISQNQLILSISKQLSLIQITDDHTHELKQLMRLKGHQQKVKSMDNMNKRIIASAAPDCVYVWDLYKDNQNYAIREKGSPSAVGFVKNAKKIVVGYSDWSAKVFDVETLRRVRTVGLDGVPLTSMKVDDNVHYLGGFPNTLTIIDMRVSEPIKHQIGSEAITCLKGLSGLVMTGNRESKINLFDVREGKSYLEWQAHSGMTNWDKPNGIANLDYCDEKIFSFGVNDRLIKKWQLI